MLRFAFNFLMALLLLGVISVAAVAWYILPQLPDIETLKDVRLQVPLRIYTADGSLIGEFGEKRRTPIRLEQVPKQMIEAFIAAEDDRFYEHPGVDWQGLTRAAIHLLRTGDKTQGGSTITMQVARNFFLSREKTYLRKLNEIFLALKIERELSKDDILELYLNKIYLGQRAYGVAAAAEVYYGKSVEQLTLPEIAMIAGLPKAPSATNPVTSIERARARRTYVLDRMLKLGFIDKQQYQAAVNAPETARLHTPAVEVEAPYVAEMVRAEMIGRFGEEAAYTFGYRVITTLRDHLQVAANLALRNALIAYDQRHGYRGPEHHYDLDPDTGETEWGRLLAPYSTFGGLYPALITRVAGRTAHAFLPGIGTIEIGWPGLSWARRYLSVNARGPAPEAAADVVAVGDVVRVIETPEIGWRLAQVPAVEGGFVSLRPSDGAILALVGGFDFKRSKFNRVTQAWRQPGSSFKPFIYSAALEAGFTPASIINDAPVVFEDPGLEALWRPENYTGKYYGPTRLREALAQSRNLASIRLLHAIGIPFAIEHLQRFGFETRQLPANLSLALGSGTVTPLQLARAYTVFANGGFLIEPYVIARIETYDGIVVYEAAPRTVCEDCASLKAGAPLEASRYAPRVISPQNAWIINSMTQDVIQRGTGQRARELGRRDLSGKTGTTNDQRDAWFAGFNHAIAAVGWVGFDEFTPLGNQETGARAALPMWMDYMRVALEGQPESVLERPPGLINVRIDPETGKLAGAENPNAIFEVFMADRVPTEYGSGRTGEILPGSGEGGGYPEHLF